MTIKEFKFEFNLNKYSDVWGTAMDAFFEVAGHLFDRGEYIPNKWQYKPSISDIQGESESYWFELFQKSTSEELLEIGELLYKYTNYLKFKNKDY